MRVTLVTMVRLTMVPFVTKSTRHKIILLLQTADTDFVSDYI